MAEGIPGQSSESPNIYFRCVGSKGSMRGITAMHTISVAAAKRYTTMHVSYLASTLSLGAASRAQSA
jgi:hypothetical protein